MTASDFDTYLDIYNGSTWVTSDDDGGEGLNSRVAYTLPETGTYTICARSRYANRTGAYTLSLQSAGAQRITLRSSEFDAYLAFGTMSGSSFESVESVETDDDSGGGAFDHRHNDLMTR